MKREFDIVIIGGLGHVGLPLGIVFASKGLKVCLNDINHEVAKKVEKGILPYVEHGADKLLKEVISNGNLKVSLDPKSISKAKTVIIAIGTPVDEYLNPKIRQFLKFIKDIKSYLDPSQLIIIRSSIFPQTFDKIIKELGSEQNWDIAYCPERIVQGFAIKEFQELTQIISGITDKAIQRSSYLFKKISKKVIHTSVGEAELAKLFSNAWRYIQFGIANQFYMISKDYGEDYNNIRDIMTDGYERTKGLPASGFAAGPCLLKDTMQLSSFYNNRFLLGQAAMNINEGLPNYIIKKLQDCMDLENKKIGILGMAFKADVDDIRDSLSYKLRKILIFNGAEVFCSDPYVDDPDFIKRKDLIQHCDLIIIGSPHTSYKNIDLKGKKFFDIWNIVKKGKSI